MSSQISSPTLEDVWRTYDSAELRLSSSLSERMLDLANLNAGMHVLDLATGRGEPAIRAAHRVSPTGTVLGVDLEESMLQIARERADREGVTNLDLSATNIESLSGVRRSFYQVALARWGLMYLTNPVNALAATRQTLTPDGILVAAVWVEPERATYYTLPRSALSKYSPIEPIDEDMPGAFYYANESRLSADFAAAGFKIQHLEDIEVAVMEAETDADLIRWALSFGMSTLLRNVSETIRNSWEAEFVRLAEPLRKDGYIRLGGVSRIVVATNKS